MREVRKKRRKKGGKGKWRRKRRDWKGFFLHEILDSS